MLRLVRLENAQAHRPRQHVVQEPKAVLVASERGAVPKNGLQGAQCRQPVDGARARRAVSLELHVAHGAREGFERVAAAALAALAPLREEGGLVQHAVPVEKRPRVLQLRCH